MRTNRFHIYLVVIFIAGMVIRLIPLAEYALVGDDLGRYIHQVDALLENGVFSYSFPGWASTEAEFVGFYGLFGILVALFGTSTAETLSIAPLFSLIAIAMVILLTLKIFRNEKIALLAGAFLAVSPLFTLISSRPVKAVLGFPIFGLCLLALYLSYRDKRGLSILYMSTLALVLTHNLTTYFLIIGVLSISFFREISRKSNDWEKLRIELPYLAYLLISALTFTFVISKEFGRSFLSSIQTVLPIPAWSLFILGLAFLASLPILVRIRRAGRFRGIIKLANALRIKKEKGLKRSLMAFGIMASMAIIFLYIPLPIGLEYSLNPLQLIWIIPSALSISFALAGQLHCKGDEKLFVYLTIAPIISLAIGLVTQVSFLYPYRHADYIVMPGFVLVGVALTRVKVKRKKLLKYGTIALLVVCGLVAYPPSPVRSYDEGFTDGEVNAIRWIMTSEIRPEDVVAADLGESGLIFGLAKHENVTWNEAYWIFVAESYNESCRCEVENQSISYVFVSSQMWRSGIVAKSGRTETSIGDYAIPGGAALVKFFDEPFDLVYTNYNEYFDFSSDDLREHMLNDETGELDIRNLPRDSVWIFKVNL